MVVAEDAVWNSYISSHKAVGQFRHRGFSYYDQLTSIYAKDRAIGKYAQTTADIVEEIDVEDVATANDLQEGNYYRGCEDDVFLDEMDASTTQSQPPKPNQDSSTSSKKQKKISDGSEQISTSIIDASMLLGENIRIVGLKLSRSIASEKVIQECAQKLYPILYEVERLTENECYHALSKILDHPTQILIFFSIYILQYD
ncbi:Chaperone DnaK [Gossypium australe]|uniref:Chaperone DnaK n=1 Tax=Gossypium australe TaxID=47621 RepID=A0A5B6VYA0_9ROSI|nr:Chaperone DnaK [Gossypium australe]